MFCICLTVLSYVNTELGNEGLFKILLQTRSVEAFLNIRVIARVFVNFGFELKALP